VDVEEHRDADAGSADDEGWLAEAERSALRLLPAERRLRATTRCWTQKEAVLKGLGVGLRQAPVSVVTPVAECGWVDDWWLTPLPVPAPHVATLAVQGSAVPAVPIGDLFLGDS
jgi:4'-phosphopantetheinyl transferase